MVILFDFDGTICNSLSVYLKFYNQYLTKRHKETITKRVIRAHGVLAMAKMQKIPTWQLFWMVLLGRIYTSSQMHRLFPFEGITHEIEKLSQKNTLGVVTSNSKRNVVNFLAQHNMSKHFSFIESKVSYFGKAQKLSQVIDKYHIKKSDCIYVGDETRDIQAAKKAGIGSAGVTWGFETKKLLSKSQPDITITKISYLSHKLSEFFPKHE